MEKLGQQENTLNDRPPTPTPTPTPPKDRDTVKAIVITQDSKVVTIKAPAYLIRPAFTANPDIPSRSFYLACRIFDWIAFGVHVIGIGMATLATQICSVLLMIVATVFTVYRIGCADSQFGRVNEDDNSLVCWVTPTLKATISCYPIEQPMGNLVPDEEKGSIPRAQRASPKRERRQDLLTWMDLTEDEEKLMVSWGLIPHSASWMEEYLLKKREHRQLNRG